MAWATVSPRITRILPLAASSVVSISAIALPSQRVSGLGERLLKSSTAIAWRTLAAAFPDAVFGASGPRCLRMWAPVTITSAAATPQAVQTRARRQRGAGFAGGGAGSGARAGTGVSAVGASGGNGSGVAGNDVGTGPGGGGGLGAGGAHRM